MGVIGQSHVCQELYSQCPIGRRVFAVTDHQGHQDIVQYRKGMNQMMKLKDKPDRPIAQFCPLMIIQLGRFSAIDPELAGRGVVQQADLVE